MKTLILALLLLTSTAHAGWFDDDDDQQKQRIQQLEQQLAEQRNDTGDWQLATGAVVIGGIVLFLAGTALGSTTRRHGKSKH